MALIKCEECGTDISDKAAACPGCGAPVSLTARPSHSHDQTTRPARQVVADCLKPFTRLTSRSKAIVGAAILLVVLLTAYIVFDHVAGDIATAKAAVAARLLNPDGAKFRNIAALKEKVGQFAHPAMVCGDVNATNKLGGYVGYRRFLFIEGNVIFADDVGKPFPEDYYIENCPNLRDR